MRIRDDWRGFSFNQGHVNKRLSATGATLLCCLVLALTVLGLQQRSYAQDAALPQAEEGPGALDPDRVSRARAYLRDNPISPPDTTSPRATLESFVFVMNEVNALWLAVRQSYDDSNRLFLTPEEREKLFLVRALLEKAAQTFDLSDIPVTSRENASIEIALQLQEILDRIPPLVFSDIPGASAGGFHHTGSETGLPGHWTIPGTSIRILRQETGETRGHYLFSKDSVARIPDDYAVVRVLPLRADRGEDLFEYYIYTPGNLIAPLWYDVIEAGPSWLHYHLSDQAYWQWLALLLLLTCYILVLGAYVRWRRWRAVSVNEGKRIVQALLNPVLVILAANLFRYLCEDQINITGTALLIIGTTTTAIVWSATAWLVYQILQLLYVWFASTTGPARQGLDASLLRTGFRVFSLAIALIVLGYGATRIGIPIYGVIAGLGVGGLAIALAAQPTIENLIGGIILYADRMVRVGEFCQFDDLAGTVESIGIRSTRIRALDRTLITVANADLAKRKIINYSQRDQFHFRHRFGLRYETGASELKNILAALRAYLEDHEKVLAETSRVRLISYADYAVTLEAYAYVLASSNADFLGIQEEMLFDMRAIIEANGSEFAFPSSTVYLARDKGLAAENARDGEANSEEEGTQAA
ncbi:mechanosensitive ion channel family protein [Roseibium sediminicola]|uniref:Mechanosensitive ion channel family protein n=1 Tax=Roseibium sediminicola TaxID=2933272 RepID=A0ABT0GTN7_9HYPH|nr:mechanosensitive ion channel family protein [Roseibium sp. CAU 1639]MCK7612797.1 mechanosensitive ion channel family protein [Roseibium sp. CAU 1639]